MLQLHQENTDKPVMVEKKIPLKGVRPDQFFRITGTGSLTNALSQTDKEEGLLYMIIPGAKDGRILAVPIKPDGTKLPLQEFSEKTSVIPHDVVINVKPAQRVPFVPEPE